MKKLFTILSMVLLLTISINNKSYSQTGYNAVLEYGTGTWCQYCPCGHVYVNNVVINYPETVVLAYHGPPGSSDPWDGECGNMTTILGINSWPSGVVGRKTGIISYTAFNNQVVIQSNTIQPEVNINLAAQNYNSTTRELTATIEMTANQSLSGYYSIFLVMTEDNLIYSQTGNTSAGCIGGPNYVHNHVVRGMMNGDYGDTINTSGTWASGFTHTENVSYIIPAGINASNANMNIIIYKRGGSMTSSSNVTQSKHSDVDNPTGIVNNNTIATEYKLAQNYPNPFNPTTNIFFSIPKDGNVSLKFYDVLGNEVASYIDNGFLKAGSYNAPFDGAGLASGVYFYTLSTSDFVDTKKMILTK